MTIGVPTAKISREDRPPPTGNGSSTTSANSTKLENSLNPTLVKQKLKFSESGKSDHHLPLLRQQKVDRFDLGVILRVLTELSKAHKESESGRKRSSRHSLSLPSHWRTLYVAQ